MSHTPNSQDHKLSFSQNSAGSSASQAHQLDSHYLLAKAEYDACIASVGIQPGWRVLDAGCGNGVFLPHLAELVGATGSVAALDHAAESIDGVRKWIDAARPAAKFETHVCSILKLPFEDAAFDCVWCANTVQYLSAGDFDSVLAEFIRVLKPGGLLAIKEMDFDCLSLYPVNSQLRWRLFQGGTALRPLLVMSKGTSVIGARMRAFGLTLLQSRTVFVERAAPFDRTGLPYLADLHRLYARVSLDYELSPSDREAWAEIDRNIELILADPDARYRELFMLFVGRKAAASL